MKFKEFVYTIIKDFPEIDEIGHMFILSPEGVILNPPDQQGFFISTPLVDRLFFECEISAYAQVNLKEDEAPDLAQSIVFVNVNDCDEKIDRSFTYRQIFNTDDTGRKSWSSIKVGDILYFVLLKNADEYNQKATERAEYERLACSFAEQENRRLIEYLSVEIPSRIAMDFRILITNAKKLFLQSKTYHILLHETALFFDFSINRIYDIWKYEYEIGDPICSPYLEEYQQYLWDY